MFVSTVAAPVASILPGGCYPSIPLARPAEPKPWERNCWDPTKWGVQLPGTDADVQAVEATQLLG